ncbi:hypothetical protein AGLY_016845 [Aphis glycines]|uniref:Uncharacterized protein n=1 Tax=Aphis glycines TaxID=307491 RepID=A0A6G0SWI7_APHGL|nr:hypothetical protein AGLY_016845 [Aphis glycines]
MARKNGLENHGNVQVLEKMLKSATQLPAIIESDNTTSIEVISLDQKSSIAFCKICYSGGSCEQLIHPCFCKVAECRESAQLLIALVHLPLLVFGLPYILWCVSCLRRVVAFWVKPGVLVVVVANLDTNLRMCNNISNASLVHCNYWCAYYPETCHGHSSIRITLDTRHGHTNLALISRRYLVDIS